MTDSRLDNILLTIWKSFVILCAVACNVLFSIFRAFQASLPFPHPQHLIINVLFDHLSVVWQVSNIISAVFILFIDVADVETDLFAYILYFLRQVQVYSATLYNFFISIARFFAHFWSNSYFNLPHRSLGIAAMLITVVVASITNASIGLMCFEGKDHLIQFKCLSGKTVFIVTIFLIPVAFLNFAIILSYIVKKRRFFLRSVQRFFMPNLSNSVAPAPAPVEMLTISGAVDDHNPNPTSNSVPTELPDNVTFTTGLITMILTSVGAGIVLLISDALDLTSSKAKIGLVYSFLNTTFISIYWLLANSRLRSFTMNVFEDFLQRWFY